MRIKAPSNFKWVIERSKCSMPVMFERLKLAAEKDVEERNLMVPPYDPLKFAIAKEIDRFSIVKYFNPPLIANDLRQFSLTDGKLHVSDARGIEQFVATVTLNEAGECRFKIEQQEMECWQVLFKALGDLFF